MFAVEDETARQKCVLRLIEPGDDATVVDGRRVPDDGIGCDRGLNGSVPIDETRDQHIVRGIAGQMTSANNLIERIDSLRPIQAQRCSAKTTFCTSCFG